jgi:hypothetical protein
MKIYEMKKKMITLIVILFTLFKAKDFIDNNKYCLLFFLFDKSNLLNQI